METLTLGNIEFNRVEVSFISKGIENIFQRKTNRTVVETLENQHYSSLKPTFSDLTETQINKSIGHFLLELKSSNDNRYNHFLNKYGDSMYCKFRINDHLDSKGLYAWTENHKLKYIGRCTDSFKKRINSGYGNISPKNCFKDGQATNCHLNAILNKSEKPNLYVHPMLDKDEIHKLEKELIQIYQPEWNIQLK